MPFRAARRYGEHRIATIALYRALLTQSKALPDPHPELLHLIRNRFKQSQYVTSVRRLRVSFEAGYEAIDLLDNAVAGNTESQERIASLLERAPARAKEPAPLKEINSRKVNKANQSDDGVTRVKKSIFDRPLPLDQLSGKRHVPVLFNANWIPVLRIKKPQPEHLSGYIRGRIEERQKWSDQKLHLEGLQYIAGLEDKWDDLIEDFSGEKAMGDECGNEGSWEDAIEYSLMDIQRKIAKRKEVNRIMAGKMQAVVDREQALVDKEREERQQAKQRRHEEVNDQTIAGAR